MENKEFIQSQSSKSCHSEQSEGSTNVKRSFVAKAPQDDKKNTYAVLLVNFGGPDSLSSVKPFLYNLFSDPTVLNIPFINLNSKLSTIGYQLSALYRKPLAWLISNMRNNASKEMYKKVGGISPLIPLTYLQAQNLQMLFNRNELPIDVYTGFRYSKPFMEGVLDEMVDLGYKKIVVLPLYPQYSYTTTGSTWLILNNWIKKNKKYASNIYFISNWFSDEDYIESYSSLIKNSLERLDLRSTELIFSAHSIPIVNIKNGDPYEKQIKQSVELIINKLDWKRKFHIRYQSKLGPVKWLEPGTDKVIEEIAKKNKNTNILVVPISFVCEHVETIYEIGIFYKELAKSLGIKRFARVPALNTNKYLIQALYNQVVDCLRNNQIDVRDLITAK